MSSTGRDQGEAGGGRKVGQGGREPEREVPACELLPFAHPVDDALLLAAVERAALHNGPRRRGVLLREFFAHLGFLYNGAATRQLRPQMDALIAFGALEQERQGRIRLLLLTDTGRRRLVQARRQRPVVLPESPQHRLWRHSRAAANERIDGYREGLRGLLDQAVALLDAGTQTESDAWFCLAKRLSAAAGGVGAAVYCLTEWAEPDDARADIDENSNPGDDDLSAEERGRRRAMRVGRRRMIHREAI